MPMRKFMVFAYTPFDSTIIAGVFGLLEVKKYLERPRGQKLE